MTDEEIRASDDYEGVPPWAREEWLRDRAAVRALVEALLPCEVCEAPATRVYIVRHESDRWEMEFCDAHDYLGPACNTWSEPADLEHAPALRALLERMREWEK